MTRLISSEDGEYEIKKKKTGIGRSRKDAVCLDDPKVSRHHASIICDEQNYFIIDNSSLNGTFVNGKRIDEIRLNDGDVISIGNHRFRFEHSASSPGLSSSEGDTVFHVTRSLEHVRKRQDEESLEGLHRKIISLPEDTHSLRESHRGLQVLQRLSRTINNNLVLENQLDSACNLILESLPGRMLSISLLSETDGKLTPHIVRSRPGAAAPPYAFLPSFAQRAIIDEICMASMNPMDELPEDVSRPGSAMASPLWVLDKVIGLLYIENEKGEKPYTEAELDLLISMAGTIAPAVQNSRLYTKVLKALQHIETQQQQLIQSEKLAGLGKIAAGLANKITDPLSGIIAMAESIIDAPDIEKAKSCAAKTIQYAETAVRIIRDLRNYTMPVGDESLGPVSVEDVIDKAIEMAVNSAILKSVKINRVKGGVTYIIAEATQLRYVILNLLTNAAEAMQGKGIIAISTKTQSDVVVIRVEDDGPGVPHEHIDKIFEPFFSLRKGEEGAGLGLTIAANIVNSFSGCIKCENLPKKGTAFTISFPAGRKINH